MKNKQFILMALMAMLFMPAWADFNWGGYFVNQTPACVQFSPYDDPGDHPKGHRSPALLPELGYDGNTFVLAVPYELENVTIVIRDEDGSVLYYETVSSITDYYMFLLDDDAVADMFSIELYYGDRHLYGEF